MSDCTCYLFRDDVLCDFCLSFLTDCLSSQSTQERKKRKSNRVGRACDSYRFRKVRCNGEQRCNKCTHYDIKCTYRIPQGKRGRKIVVVNPIDVFDACEEVVELKECDYAGFFQ